jgi:hypothetical protein
MDRSHCGARVESLREREGEMAKKSGIRRGAIILLVALAVLVAGPSAAMAKSYAPSNIVPVDASWAE